MHLLALHLVHHHDDDAVVQKQHVASFHFLRQRFVIQTYGVHIA